MRVWSACGIAVLFAACEGSGSDIGPRLDRLPDASGKVLVVDDQSRGVSGARVTIGGAIAPTGRSGRGELFANPRGRLRVDIDASAASSVSSGRPASLSFVATIDRNDVPFAIHLPDPAGGATQPVATGVGLAATTLDDSAGTGARLQLEAATVVSQGAATQVTLNLARLQPGHLPGELPTATGGAMLFTRGIYVDPPSVVFAPAAALEIPNDIQLVGAAPANLYHLDAATGEWALVATAATNTGGFISQVRGVAQGGLYVYGVSVPEVATVSGRVVDVDGRAVADALVGIDWLHTVADGNGRFSIGGVAGATADGALRTALVELHGGGSWLPTRAVTTSSPLGAGAVNDIGDVTLDTREAGNVRVQLIVEGGPAPLRRFALSSTDGRRAAVALSDARGQCQLDEIPTGFFGFFQGEPVDRTELFLVEAVGFVRAGTRWSDFNAFFDDRFWFVGSRNSRALVIDSVGGGPIRDAVVVRGSLDSEGFVNTTREGGVVFVGRDFSGRATASRETQNDSQSIISAFSIERPNGEQLELPVRQALRDAGGSFDRHGLASGPILGATPSSSRALRVTRALDISEWFDATMLGETLQSSVPAELIGDTFRAGIGVPLGNIALAEDTTAGASFTIDRLALVLAEQAREAELQPLSLSLQYTADTQFTISQALVGLDPAITAADLRMDLGLQLANGLVVDVARNVGGNLTVAGTDLVIALPGLTGELAGAAWLVSLGAVSGGAAPVTQRVFARLGGGSSSVRPMLSAPNVTAPANGATVSATGFQVDYVPPAGALYCTVELFSGGSQELRWLAVVPPDQTSFRFHELPTESPDPIIAGRTYTLTVTAFRAEGSEVVLADDPYRDLTTFWRAIGAHERGVVALSARTLTVTAN